jgi:hypothetical protein
MREPSSRAKASEVGGKSDDIGDDYRTRHNAAMNSLLSRLLRCLTAFLLTLALTGPAFAWNATGHRLIAEIAWQQLSKQSRETITGLLVLHPDYAHWAQKADAAGMRRIFAEASTWADEIRHDPRFIDLPRQGSDSPATDATHQQARHRDWHYLNYDRDGNIVGGQLDRRIGELTQILRSTAELEQKIWALPWLLHLIGDIHQPMHVGYAADAGGNGFDIDNPFSQRRPLMNLHRYWDDYPARPACAGRSWRKPLAVWPVSTKRQRKAATSTGAMKRMRCWRWLIPNPTATRPCASAKPSTNAARQLPISKSRRLATVWVASLRRFLAHAFHVKRNNYRLEQGAVSRIRPRNLSSSWRLIGQGIETIPDGEGMTGEKLLHR